MTDRWFRKTAGVYALVYTSDPNVQGIGALTTEVGRWPSFSSVCKTMGFILYLVYYLIDFRCSLNSFVLHWISRFIKEGFNYTFVYGKHLCPYKPRVTVRPPHLHYYWRCQASPPSGSRGGVTEGGIIALVLKSV